MKKLTRAEQKALRPGQILDAAFEEFVDKGYSAARVEDIAARIGVTKGTIYVYFPTKEELFAALVPHISIPFADMRVHLDRMSGPPAEKLRSVIRLFYEHILGDRRSRELLRLAVSEGMRFPQLIEAHRCEIIEPLLAFTQAVIEEGVRLGAFRAGPPSRARVVLAPVIGIMVETLIHGGRRDLDLPSYIEAHLDVVTQALVFGDDG